MKRKVLALAIGLTAVVAFASGSSLNAAHTGASGAAATNSIASERAGNSRLYVINSALYPDTVAAPSESTFGTLLADGTFKLAQYPPSSGRRAALHAPRTQPRSPLSSSGGRALQPRCQSPT